MYRDCFEGSLGDERDSDHPDGESPCSPVRRDDSDVVGRFTLDELTDLDSASRYDLVRPCDIKGILHAHSRYCDGAHNLDSMVKTAREIGLEYLGISDHFRSDAHRDGLDLEMAKVQRGEVDTLRGSLDDFDILQGIELDANPDGSLPLDDETLELFDYVIVSFPDTEGVAAALLTERVVAVAANPRVTILGKPIGDLMMRKANGLLDMDAVLRAAADGGTTVEINANPKCAELNWECCRRAQELGVTMAISPNAHRAARLVDYRHGAELAQDAGLYCASIINTLGAGDLRHYLATGSLPEA